MGKKQWQWHEKTELVYGKVMKNQLDQGFFFLGRFHLKDLETLVFFLFFGQRWNERPSILSNGFTAWKVNELGLLVFIGMPNLTNEVCIWVRKYKWAVTFNLYLMGQEISISWVQINCLMFT